MTDKQIIIDDVDVSGCDNLYTKNNKHLCRYNFEECRPKNEQCPLYVSNIEKQLELCKQVLKRKEQECEELKRQLTIRDDEAVVVEITERQFEEYQKLKQALTEIKEIAKPYNDLSGNCVIVNCFSDMNTILQKCEVLDDVI